MGVRTLKASDHLPPRRRLRVPSRVCTAKTGRMHEADAVQFGHIALSQEVSGLG